VTQSPDNLSRPKICQLRKSLIRDKKLR